MRKEQNVAVPMLESINTLNGYGLEVTSGIILGLDTDTDDTESRLKDFIELSQIPMLTINLLQALPKTPLWDRLQRDGRIDRRSHARESNVRFLRPYDEVVAHVAPLHRPCLRSRALVRALRAPGRRDLCEPAWSCRRAASSPGPIYPSALVLAWRVVLHIGILSDYRRPFWRAARHALRRGQIDAVLGHGLHRSSSDPVHPRGAARRAERVLLFGQAAQRGFFACRGAGARTGTG